MKNKNQLKTFVATVIYEGIVTATYELNAPSCDKARAQAAERRLNENLMGGVFVKNYEEDEYPFLVKHCRCFMSLFV